MELHGAILEDLDFTDDIAVLSNTRRQMQEKLNHLNVHAKSTGLKINISKTKVMRLNVKSREQINIEQKEIEDVEKFTYLGATVSNTGGAGEDMRQRIGKAWGAFNKLSKIWRSGQLQDTQNQIQNCQVKCYQCFIVWL